MSKAMTEFNFNSLPVRTLTGPKGSAWFVAKDVCDILGYSDSAQAVTKHCKGKGVSKGELVDRLGRNQVVTTISEGNLFRLILRSNKPEAEAFSDLVHDEILPKILNTGEYQTEAKKLSVSKQQLDLVVSAVLAGAKAAVAGASPEQVAALVKTVEGLQEQTGIKFNYTLQQLDNSRILAEAWASSDKQAKADKAHMAYLTKEGV